MFQIMFAHENSNATKIPAEEKNKVEKKVKDDSEKIKILMNSANIFAKEGKIEESITEYKKLLDLDKNHLKSLIMVGRHYFKLKDNESAIKFHERAEEVAGENRMCRVVLSKAYLASKSSKAIPYLKQSVKLNPNETKYLSLLAIELAKHESSREEAFAVYDKIIKLEPDNIKFAIQYTTQLIKSSLPNKAIKILSNFAIEDQTDIAYYINYANSLMAQRKYDQSQVIFDKAYKINPQNTSVILRLADCANAVGDFVKSAKYYTEYLILVPKDSSIERFKTIALQRAGKYNETDARIKFQAERQFKNKVVKFSKEQKKVFKDLSNKGYAVTSFDELFDDKDIDLWDKAEQFMDEFENSPDALERTKKIIECEDFSKDPYFKGSFKPSVVNHCAHVGNIRADNACIALIRHHKIMNIANSYNKMFSKIRNVNFWINPPVSEKNREVRKGSQLWHRDQEDENILKCFIYFSDVDDTNGATEYVPYSRCVPKKRYSKVLPYPCSSGYLNKFTFDSAINPEDIISLKGRKGTIAFLDTNGFHRGGFVTGEKNRKLMMSTFLRPSTPFVQQNTRLLVDDEIPTDGWSDQAIFAIS